MNPIPPAIAVLALVSQAGASQGGHAQEPADQCRVVHDGGQGQRTSQQARSDVRSGDTNVRASASSSSSSSSRSSVHLSSSSRGHGSARATSTTTDADGRRVTTIHDEQGCRIIVEEPDSEGD